jgi:hypothetical protein
MPLTDEPLIPQAEPSPEDEDISEDELATDEEPDEEESLVILPSDA